MPTRHQGGSRRSPALTIHAANSPFESRDRRQGLSRVDYHGEHVCTTQPATVGRVVVAPANCGWVSGNGLNDPLSRNIVTRLRPARSAVGDTHAPVKGCTGDRRSFFVCQCNLWSGRQADRGDAVCRFCDTGFVGTNGPGGVRLLRRRFSPPPSRRCGPERLPRCPPARYAQAANPPSADTTLVDSLHNTGLRWRSRRWHAASSRTH